MKKPKFFLLAVFFLITVPLNVSADPVPEITEEEKSLATDGVKNYYKGVKAAAITQDGKKVRLTIVVHYETSKKYAKQLGDNFVRLVKTFSKDKTPGDEIGEGIYDYTVSVYFPNQEEIAVGSKDGIEQGIIW